MASEVELGFFDGKKKYPISEPATEALEPFLRLRRDYKRPPLTLQYNRDAPLANLVAFQGTALKLVLLRPEFWVLFGLHVVLVGLYYGKYQGQTSLVGDTGVATKSGWPKMSTNLALIPGTLMSIFITFYVNQTFTRYFDQYFKKTDVAALDILNLLRNFVPDGKYGLGKDVRQYLFTHVIAAQLLGYASLPQNRSSGIDKWAWESLEELGLLSALQVKELKPFWDLSASAAYSECLVAANRGVWAQLATKRISQLDQCLLLSLKINELRSDFLHILAYASVPIPFSYYHLLNVFLELYLALLAYEFAFQSPWWSIAGYFLILLALLGFREIGNAMSDPFGDDDVDIPIFVYVERVYRESALLINAPTSYVDEPDFMKKDYKSKA